MDNGSDVSMQGHCGSGTIILWTRGLRKFVRGHIVSGSPIIPSPLRIAFLTSGFRVRDKEIAKSIQKSHFAKVGGTLFKFLNSQVCFSVKIFVDQRTDDQRKGFQKIGKNIGTGPTGKSSNYGDQRDEISSQETSDQRIFSSSPNLAVVLPMTKSTNGPGFH